VCFRQLGSVIDIRLTVVMCAWLFDIALSAMVNVARFDLGTALRPVRNELCPDRAARRERRAAGPPGHGLAAPGLAYRRTELARMIRVAPGC
jgi:hypothetical protein